MQPGTLAPDLGRLKWPGCPARGLLDLSCQEQASGPGSQTSSARTCSRVSEIALLPFAVQHDRHQMNSHYMPFSKFRQHSSSQLVTHKLLLFCCTGRKENEEPLKDSEDGLREVPGLLRRQRRRAARKVRKRD